MVQHISSTTSKILIINKAGTKVVNRIPSVDAISLISIKSLAELDNGRLLLNCGRHLSVILNIDDKHSELEKINSQQSKRIQIPDTFSSIQSMFVLNNRIVCGMENLEIVILNIDGSLMERFYLRHSELPILAPGHYHKVIINYLNITMTDNIYRIFFKITNTNTLNQYEYSDSLVFCECRDHKIDYFSRTKYTTPLQSAFLLLSNGGIIVGYINGNIELVEDKSRWKSNEPVHAVLTLSGHTGKITALVELPSGFIVSGSEDKTVRVWDMSFGTCIRTITSHHGVITALSVLPDGRFVSAASFKEEENDKWEMSVWKPSKAKSLKPFPKKSKRQVQHSASLDVRRGTVDLRQRQHYSSLGEIANASPKDLVVDYNGKPWFKNDLIYDGNEWHSKSRFEKVRLLEGKEKVAVHGTVYKVKKDIEKRQLKTVKRSAAVQGLLSEARKRKSKSKPNKLLACFPALFCKSKVHPVPVPTHTLSLGDDALKRYVNDMVKDLYFVERVIDVQINKHDVNKTIVLYTLRSPVIFDTKPEEVITTELATLIDNPGAHIQFNVQTMKNRKAARPPSSLDSVVDELDGLTSLNMQITKITLNNNLFQRFRLPLLDAYTSDDKTRVAAAYKEITELFFAERTGLLDLYTSIPALSRQNLLYSKRQQEYTEFEEKFNELNDEITTNMKENSQDFMPSVAEAYVRIIKSYGERKRVYDNYGDEKDVNARLCNQMLKYLIYLKYTESADKSLLNAFVGSAGPMALKVMQKYAEVRGLKDEYKRAFKMSYENNSAMTSTEFKYIRSLLCDDPASSISHISSKPLSVASLGQVHYANIKASIDSSTRYDHAILKMIKPSALYYILCEACTSSAPLYHIKDGKMADIVNKSRLMILASMTDVQKYIMYMMFGIIDEMNFNNEYKNIVKGSSVYADHANRLYTVEAYGTHNKVLPVLIMGIAPGTSLNTVIRSKNVALCEKIVTTMKTLIYKWVYTALLDPKGYAHVDLHSGNIFVDPSDGRVTLIDFGNFVTIPKKTQCLLLNVFLLHNTILVYTRLRSIYIDKLIKAINKLCDIVAPATLQPVLRAFYESPKRDQLGELFKVILKHIATFGLCATGVTTDFSKGIDLLEKSWNGCAGRFYKPLTAVFVDQLKQRPGALMKLKMSVC